MLILLSPAKKLDFSPPPPALDSVAAPDRLSAPLLAADAAHLTAIAARLSEAELARLMDLSPALASLNHARFQALATGGETEVAAAALAFAGDVYQGLDARSLTPDDLAFAQRHLLILSGLYGVLRPLDRLQPYRLEMGSRLANPAGASLYDHWRPRLAAVIAAQLEASGGGGVLNLASDEYFKAVDAAALGVPVVTPSFREAGPDGRARVMFPYAKVARGLMARHAITSRHTRIDAVLASFTAGGYRLRPDLGTATEPVYVRPKPAPKGRAAAGGGAAAPRR